ncbi:hypothetical protein M5K25_024007 [Dendrobium thyrsiflorum]|uniref:HMA domain-containing protein n=1 Tax=Dendrobium thyrsiflorum TaxID=117978 RepID=A0ABD0U0U0_DENTH
MGEEGKKPEEKKVEEKKAENKAEGEKTKAEEGKKEGGSGGVEQGGGDGGKKEGGEDGKAESAPVPPPPPEEILMRVYMHCEGCARKVKRSLKGFDGVEEVTTDCKTHKVVVKGKKAAEDPLKVVERVQKKSGRKVELLTPLPPPKPEKKEEEKKEEKPKPEEKKEPPVISVVLKVHMHCEACAQEIKKRILKMKGVQAADPDLKASQVTVKGIMDPSKLVEYVYKRTGKHSVIVNSDTAEKKPEEAAASPADDKNKSSGGDEKKAGDVAGDEKKTDGEKKAEAGVVGEAGEDKEKKEGGSLEEAATVGKVLELKKNEFYYYYPRYPTEYQSYAPQLFSDENPNACSVM